ncbi:MAG TPA: hypothetical protein VFW19_02690 [Allosphingosinicella sp.]|nr:hypothetical protein [Allosphingosinicella sp.]
MNIHMQFGSRIQAPRAFDLTASGKCPSNVVSDNGCCPRADKASFWLHAFILACCLVGLFGPARLMAQSTDPTPPRRVTDGRGYDLLSGQAIVHAPLATFGKETSLYASLEVRPGNNPSWTPQPPYEDLYTVVANYVTLKPQAFSNVSGEPYDFLGEVGNATFPHMSGYFLAGPPNKITFDGKLVIHQNADGSYYGKSIGTTGIVAFTPANKPNEQDVYASDGTLGVNQPDFPYYNFSQVVYPNGEIWYFYRQTISVTCTPPDVPPCHLTRLRSIVSSRGYAVQFLYVSDAQPASNTQTGGWLSLRKVTPYNKAFVACDESLMQECVNVSALPSATLQYDTTAGTVTITPPSGKGGIQLTVASMNGHWTGISSVQKVGVPNSQASYHAASDDLGNWYVDSITDQSGTWNYSRIIFTDEEGHPPTYNATSTNPQGQTVSIGGYTGYGDVTGFNDELNRSWGYPDGGMYGYPYMDLGRYDPENNGTSIVRDDRNNVLAEVLNPKPSSGLPPITIYSAVYPVDCTNPKTCNHPASVKDGNGNETDYTYAPEHGGVLTETGPVVSGVRPQKRYTYAQRYPWVLNASGTYVRAANPIWVLTQTSFCKVGNPNSTNTGCANGSTDQVVTTYDYGPDVGPNNLNLRGTVVDVGGLNLRTCASYDALGNKISETKPRAGLATCP